MRSLNLFLLSRVTYLPFFAGYEKQLSQRKEALKNVKEKEIVSLRTFVDQLSSSVTDGTGVNDLGVFEHFYFSFSIEKISKEFDLLRLGENYIVDIELKSQLIDLEKIKKQLNQNCYYLQAVNRNVHAYTYASDVNRLFILQDNGELIETSFQKLIDDLLSQLNCYDGEIDDLFCASQYLISPMNTPDRFLNSEYFLTGQQEEIEKRILNMATTRQPLSIGVTGRPGTGKTLLIYDLARKVSDLFGKTCIIHCGTMPSGLYYLNSKLPGVDIIPAKRIADYLSNVEYSFVFVDESQRIWAAHFDYILAYTKANGASVVFSYDPNQILSSKEENREIAERITRLQNIQIFKLTNKIRTNRQLASFIQRLLGKPIDEMFDTYPDAQILYADNVSEAKLMLCELRKQGYTFINYSGSNYNRSHFTAQYNGDIDTHHVVGQEYENVVMILDDTFAYDENNRLRAKIHPNPDYLYLSLLYQGLSRVRSKLAIIVVQDYPLFEKIMNKFNLLES